MQRREFSRTAAVVGAATTLVTIGIQAAVGDPAPAPAPAPAPPPTPSPQPQAVAPAPPAPGFRIGVNLSGMEWAESGHRYGGSTQPNLHFTVPRRADVEYLAANGYKRFRLPIKWEMLQPMLHDTVANAAARAAIGEPGAFHAGYEAYITGVLDACASVGARCIVDLHNYCRYRDFVYQPDGSVIGLVTPNSRLLRPFTSDYRQVQQRIFALATGTTLKQSNFTDFWTRAALKWKGHPGFGGYGLMNEPYNMPSLGTIEESYDGSEDLMIWPAYAQAAINAIRAVDAANPIYLSGNFWSSAMYLAEKNPAWPLAGSNIVYEVHMYLDAFSNGQSFDYDSEVAKNYSAGFGGGVPINADTGAARLQMALDWAQSHGVKLALTETGMPIDDPRWQEMFQRLANLAGQAGCEIYNWHGGNHCPLHNHAINHVPGWHQNRTLEPLSSGPLKAAAGVAKATLFDDGPGWAPSGTPVTITVYARGYLPAPLSVQVTSSNGGSFSKSTLTIPAGANGQDTFIFTSPPNTIVTLSYSSATAGIPLPPPRRVYSLNDPVAYAWSTHLWDGAKAIIAKYSACKWELGEGFIDYMNGWYAAPGDPVRAVADSGYGSSCGNAMEMINWLNDEPGMGPMVPPVMRRTNGWGNSDHSAPETWGFWCRKSLPAAGKQPNPRNRTLYNIEDAHFAIAAVSVPRVDNTGVLFQASNLSEVHCSELSFSNSQPQARWVDASGATVLLTCPTRLIANTPAVVSFTSVTGAQRLRVNSQVVGSASASFAPSAYDQMLLGWGFLSYYPQQGFGGNIFSSITGKGAPSAQEMEVLERYLGATAGL
jgi:hypothetical protein